VEIDGIYILRGFEHDTELLLLLLLFFFSHFFLNEPRTEKGHRAEGPPKGKVVGDGPDDADRDAVVHVVVHRQILRVWVKGTVYPVKFKRQKKKKKFEQTFRKHKSLCFTHCADSRPDPPKTYLEEQEMVHVDRIPVMGCSFC
jgi:hypothetical protein